MDLFGLVWLLFVLEIATCLECPALYRRYSADHIYCMKSTCNVDKQGVSKHEIKIILDIHNKARSIVATARETKYDNYPPAANMMQMEWDDELAAVVQKEASLCKYGKDFTWKQRATEYFQPGYLVRRNSGVNQIEWESLLVDGWLSEVQNFFPEYIYPYFYKDTYAFFTQMIWAESWKIGCGAALFNKTEALYICYYGPAGNSDDRSVYEIGSPCSKCPKNTACSNEYEGLCKSLSPLGPIKERIPDEDVFFYCNFGEDDPRECMDKHFTGATFKNRRTAGGVYKTAMLKGGEHIGLNLGKFKHHLGICPFIVIRNGPNDVRDKDNDATINIKFNGEGVYKSIGTSSSWWLIPLHSESPKELEVEIVYELAKGKSLQYLDIKGFGVGKGKCPHRDMI